MAALILEVTSRHGSQLFPIDKPAIRIGRALDNDVILTDPTVSPYHCVIRETVNGGHELLSLADENGIRVKHKTVNDAIDLDKLPQAFEAGRTSFRVLDRSQPVSATRLINCRNSGACIFGHWGWAIALFTMMLVLSAYENYLSTPRLLDWDSFWSDQLVITGTALALSLGLLLVNRFTSHRWDFSAALSFTSLALILVYLLEHAISFANYFFTSEFPGLVANIILAVVLLPLATAWFLVRLNHGNHASAWVFIVVLFTPSAYLQVKQLASHYHVFEDFSSETHYSNALQPWDIRLADTITIDQFNSDNLLTRPSILPNETEASN